jgi:hypothetical protein
MKPLQRAPLTEEDVEAWACVARGDITLHDALISEDSDRLDAKLILSALRADERDATS